MALVDRVRPRIGDVIEIETPKGYAYAQYTHKHSQYGALLRVIEGRHQSRPGDFSGMVRKPPQFTTFFPLGAACNRGLVRVVAHEPIPQEASTFPLFRSGVSDREGRIATWWLWDGEKEWPIGNLEPGMERLPLRGIWNETLLVERIVEGWRHENVI